MEEKLIPFASLENCCRKIINACSGVLNKEKGYLVCTTPKCIIYSRNLLDPTEETFYESLKSVVCGKDKGRTGQISFIAEYAPEGYKKILEETGFRRVTVQTGMIYFFKDDYFITDKAVRHIERSDIPEWEEVLFKGFGPVKVRETGVYEKFFDYDNVTLFGYYKDDHIIGTTMVIADNEETGIHEVTVLPEHRRKGVCNTIIRNVLAELQQKNISCVSLQASIAGRFAYEQIGFKPVCMIETWSC